MRNTISLSIVSCLAMIAVATGQDADVVGGQTSVLLDTDLLSMAAGLDLSSVSADVGPGNLGAASVAFDINPRDAALFSTTFSYTVGDLAPSSGSIEQTGLVFFNNDSLSRGWKLHNWIRRKPSDG